MVEKAHPNVFEIVKNFIKEQASTQVSLVQLATSAAPPGCHRKVIQRDRMIAELHHRFASNLVSIEEYLSGVSAHTNL